MTYITYLLHSALDAITDGGRHPDNAALLVIAAIIIGMGAAGWLD